MCYFLKSLESFKLNQSFMQVKFQHLDIQILTTAYKDIDILSIDEYTLYSLKNLV